MTVGFFYVQRQTVSSEQNYDCARILVSSSKRVMPYVKVVQFTDEDTPRVKGVDAVRRKRSEPMALLRMRHHACVEGDWLFVDTDVVFQKTVRKVFQDATWDIGITSRDWTHLRPASGFSERMPYNTGVVFSRNPRFWQEVYTRLRREKNESEQEWMGDQAVIGEILTEEPCRYEVKVLSGRKFNYPPVPSGVDLAVSAAQLEADASIMHFKGPERKAQMLTRFKREMKRCA